MKILVTGGAGFIGSAVVRYLIQNTKHKVIIVDKLTYAGNLESLREVANSKRFYFEKVDICDEQKIKDVFANYSPNIVMHLAAESHVDRSIDGPSDFINTNIFGTYNMLQCSREYYETLSTVEREQFRFHHISTDEVYGDLPHPDLEGDIALSKKFSEQNSYNPSSPYSASKASSDHLVRAWGRTYGLPVVITNCSNNYGPYHFPEKLIPLTILNALKGKRLPIYGNGNQIRDWLYVDDHAEALVLVAKTGKTGETYNIGGNNEIKNLDVVKKICEILDKLRPKTGSYADLITFVEDRPGHDMRYAIDASKIKSELLWSPKQTFDTGLLKTVEWYLENQSWCENVFSGGYKMERLGINASFPSR